jgi:small subunit ribosomal protein S9
MTTKTSEKYIEGIGRRKTSVARVRITPSAKESIVINDKPIAEYFDTLELQKIVSQPLKDIEGVDQKFTITIKVLGGGIKGQAEAIRLGVARCLVKFNADLRTDLKKAGFLKRDPRIKERKKPGLKKARKSAQWSKR